MEGCAVNMKTGSKKSLILGLAGGALMLALAAVFVFFVVLPGANSGGGSGDPSAEPSAAEPSGGEELAASPSPPAPSGDPIDLTVWGSHFDQAFLERAVEEFEKANPDKNYNISLGIVSEGDALTSLSENPERGADVFIFIDDHLRALVRAGLLLEVTQNKSAIIAANSPHSVASASLGGWLWAYPWITDNGYFLYYDKSVISDEQAQSLDAILAACEDAGKLFGWEISSAWWGAGWYLTQVSFGFDEETDKMTTDLDTKGVPVIEAMLKMVASPAYSMPTTTPSQPAWAPPMQPVSAECGKALKSGKTSVKTLALPKCPLPPSAVSKFSSPVFRVVSMLVSAVQPKTPRMR
jgi:maltose-binding protein MalE